MILNLGNKLSIEFGIFRSGSTITMYGDLRVTADEQLFDSFDSLWELIEQKTGESLCIYESADFIGESLDQFILLTESYKQDTKEQQNFIIELLHVAGIAKSRGVAFVFRGL